MSADPHVPPGWEHDPSAWRERLPIVALALAGAAVAGYLTLYQIGAIDEVWEPFFGGGSERILTSSVSRVLPIPDAALGLLAYLADAITGLIGGRGRWRTRPLIVILFGLAVGPLGAVSVLLVVLQPLLFGTWCTLCLVSAAISLAMIGPAMDEVLASLQMMRLAPTTPRRERTGSRAAQVAALGIGLLVAAAPAILGYAGPAAVAHQVLGALTASIAIVAVFEVTRGMRRLHVLGAAGLIVTGAMAPDAGAVMVALAGAASLLVLQLPTSRPRHALGGGWRAIFR